MPEIHQVVDEIRATLRAMDRDGNGNGTGGSGFGLAPAAGSDDFLELSRLAKQYAEACSETNRRLKHCERLLNAGLTTEAIHAAEEEPKLLPLIGFLEFEEAPDWVRLTQDVGLEVPVPLFLESAEALDRAFAEMNPIASLLREHRRLALCRAGLGPRIAQLEKLAVADRGNTIWEDDIRTYQQARLPQIEAEAAEAERTLDLATLEALAHEMATTEWRDRPASESVNRLRKRANRLRREIEYRKLPELAERLALAESLGDTVAGQAAKAQWDEAIAIAKPQAGDPVVASAGRALGWLAQRDAERQEAENRANALAALEDALKAPATTARELRTLAASARSFGALPEPLRKRLDAQLLKLERGSSRRRKLVAAVLGLTMATTAALMGWQAWRAALRTRIETESANLAKLTDARQFDAALARLEEIERTDPALASSTELVAIRESTVKAAKVERKRVEDFKSWMTRALAADLGDPDPEGLEEARALAWSPAEKASVADLDRQRSERAAQDLEILDRKLDPDVAAIDKEVGAFELLLGGTTPTKELIQSAEDLARRQVALAKSISEGSRHREAVNGLGEKIDSLRKTLGERADQERDEARITQALRPDPDQPRPVADVYLAAVQQFLQRHPDTPAASQLKSAMTEEQELALWRDAFAWSSLLNEWKTEGKSLPRDVEAITRSLRGYLDNHKDGLSRAVAERLLAACDAVARRDKARKDLLELFNEPIMKVFVIKLMKDRRYYTISDPMIDLRQLNLHKVIVFKDEGKRDNNGDIVTFINSQDIIAPIDRSAQHGLAAQARDLLENDEEAPWEETMVQILQSFRENKEIDPLLQARTLRDVARLASQGSEPLRVALAADLKRLQGVNDVADWKDPDNEGAREARREATSLTSRLKFSEVLARAIKERGELHELFTRELFPVGWLRQTSAGVWTCQLGEVPPSLRGASLWAAEPIRGGGKRWRKFGSLGDGAVNRIEAGVRPVEGRPLFAGGPPGFDE
ncbi:MAG: hypothetical protein AB7I30_10240 [Isosphaeraceae bacterium]